MNGQRESIGKVNSRLAVANPSKLDSSKLKEAHDAVAMLELLHFAPEWRDFQFVPMGVPKGETSARREELGQIGIIEQFLGEGSRTAADVLFAVRRVGQDKVKDLAGGKHLGQGGEHILRANVEVGGGQPGGGDIAADEFGVTRGQFHAHREFCAAAE